MGVLFRCEADAFNGESTDAQEMNVRSCHRKIVTITRTTFLEYLLHHFPPVNQSRYFGQKPYQISVLVHGAMESKFWFGSAPEVPLCSEDRFENLWKDSLRTTFKLD